MAISDFANELPPGARLTNLSDYLVEETLVCPIDAFLVRMRSILADGNERVLDASDYQGRLLCLGLVSAAESYFRSVLAASMELCPLSKSVAADKNINLGGLLWHGHDRYSQSAFDNSSFSNAQELKKAAKDYLGFVLEDAVFKVPLEEYDKVCQFRHGIVHSDGILPGKNAVKLDIPRYRGAVRIVVRYRHLQDVAAVLNTLVVLFNRQLFLELCKRWAIDWRRRADWIPSDEVAVFSRLWSIFHSREEWSSKPGRSAVTRKRCMDTVKLTYNI